MLERWGIVLVQLIAAAAYGAWIYRIGHRRGVAAILDMIAKGKHENC